MLKGITALASPRASAAASMDGVVAARLIAERIANRYMVSVPKQDEVEGSRYNVDVVKTL